MSDRPPILLRLAGVLALVARIAWLVARHLVEGVPDPLTAVAYEGVSCRL